MNKVFLARKFEFLALALSLFISAQALASDVPCPSPLITTTHSSANLNYKMCFHNAGDCYISKNFVLSLGESDSCYDYGVVVGEICTSAKAQQLGVSYACLKPEWETPGGGTGDGADEDESNNQDELNDLVLSFAEDAHDSSAEIASFCTNKEKGKFKVFLNKQEQVLKKALKLVDVEAQEELNTYIKNIKSLTSSLCK